MAISLNSVNDRLSILEHKHNGEIFNKCSSEFVVSTGYPYIHDMKTDWRNYNFVVIGWNVWSGETGNSDNGPRSDTTFVMIPTVWLASGFWWSYNDTYSASDSRGNIFPKNESIRVSSANATHLRFEAGSLSECFVSHIFLINT